MLELFSILKSPTVIAVFILELAERTAYYGTIFSISTYATLMLRIDTGAAFIITNTVFALAPLSAFFAGIMADTWFHRVEILLAAALCYAVAIGVLALSALPAFFGDGDFAEPSIVPFLLFFPGLILLSVGYGAFKVCTAPLVAEGVLSLAKTELKFVVSGVDDTAIKSAGEEKNAAFENPVGKSNSKSNNGDNTTGSIHNSKTSYMSDENEIRRMRLSDRKQYEREEREKNFVLDDAVDESDQENEDGDSAQLGAEAGGWEEDLIVEEDNLDDNAEDDDDHEQQDEENKDSTNANGESSASRKSRNSTAVKNSQELEESPAKSSEDNSKESTLRNHEIASTSQSQRNSKIKTKPNSKTGKANSEVSISTDVDSKKSQDRTKHPERKAADKETLLAFTYSVYAAVINLGSLLGFTFVPSLRTQGGIEFTSGTVAEDGKKKPAGFIYSWGTCFIVSIVSVFIFFLMAKFSRRFVRPKGFASLWISSSSSSVASKPHQSASEHDHNSSSTHISSGEPKPAHPMEFVANLAEAVGLSFLVNCCCREYGSAFIYNNNNNKVKHDAGVDGETQEGGTDSVGHRTTRTKESVLEAGLLAEVEEEDEEATRVRKHVGSFVSVLKIFFVLPIYWFTTALTSSSFQVQAFCAALPDWLTVDMLNTANTVAFLVSLPVIQFGTSKLLQRLHRTGSLFFGCFQSVLILRLFLGFVVAALAMIIAGFLQVKIDSVATLTENGDCILKDQAAVASDVLPGPLPISLTFVLAGVASAFCDPAALEAAFELAPANMRSTVMSLYLLESSLSGFVGLGLSPAFANPSTFTASFFSLAIVLVLLSIVWAAWVRNVHKQTAPRAVAVAAYNAATQRRHESHQNNNKNESEEREQRQSLLAEA